MSLVSRLAAAAAQPAPPTSKPRRLGAIALGAFLAFAGTSHLTFARSEFQAQVPDWVPLDNDAVVLLSGVAEISLGAALILLRKRRVPAGWAAAAFFVAIFPGNISQYVTHTDAFGLDTDGKRLGRLFFQPLLVIWALWSTGAWKALRAAAKK
ncbi:hypothetical protein MUG94_15675 [Arthrobacter gengyunqii]|uniref:DoxX family membrane protein n=1 Tax=Arthrobacter gengyunqii TaxID=2886940 RepID=A0A9X1S4Q8_9MICC|nr:hypothetical protein [Arthrobacter gengyunqii]MCC3268555.1 hypothetical protein [Arthrobacter gengyunqii]UOY95943.1 hypothetical protein MUG94_15675 [Arthrobacter gengyunqii]